MTIRQQQQQMVNTYRVACRPAAAPPIKLQCAAIR